MIVEKPNAIDRREFLFGSSTLGMLFLLNRARQRPNSSEINDNYKDFEGSDIPNLRPFGTHPATPDEVEAADRLLSASPANKSPIDVMKYLEALPDRNVDHETYNGGWRYRWNPLIVRLFSETKTKPAGDTTAWCAAALNWTLARSGYRSSGSASSSSFRASQGLTDKPQVGDIVVFQRTDPEEARVGHGHVGLFLAQHPAEILVLGGNQKNEYGHHAVCRRWIQKKGKVLIFHSFHSIKAFI
jgi:uncharacterized protein (TIGR02594 family)